MSGVCIGVRFPANVWQHIVDCILDLCLSIAQAFWRDIVSFLHFKLEYINLTACVSSKYPGVVFLLFLVHLKTTCNIYWTLKNKVCFSLRWRPEPWPREFSLPVRVQWCVRAQPTGGGPRTRSFAELAQPPRHPPWPAAIWQLLLCPAEPRQR